MRRRLVRVLRHDRRVIAEVRVIVHRHRAPAARRVQIRRPRASARELHARRPRRAVVFANHRLESQRPERVSLRGVARGLGAFVALERRAPLRVPSRASRVAVRGVATARRFESIGGAKTRSVPSSHDSLRMRKQCGV
jgi:hypothetical protein